MHIKSTHSNIYLNQAKQNYVKNYVCVLYIICSTILLLSHMSYVFLLIMYPEILFKIFYSYTQIFFTRQHNYKNFDNKKKSGLLWHTVIYKFSPYYTFMPCDTTSHQNSGIYYSVLCFRKNSARITSIPRTAIVNIPKKIK